MLSRKITQRSSLIIYASFKGFFSIFGNVCASLGFSFEFARLCSCDIYEVILQIIAPKDYVDVPRHETSSGKRVPNILSASKVRIQRETVNHDSPAGKCRFQVLKDMS